MDCGRNVNMLGIGAMRLASDIVCLVCESRIVQPQTLTVGQIVT
jgi:hypothetical protein